MDNQQPPQTPPEIIVSQPKPNYLKTIIFSVLAIVTLGLIAYLVFQNQKLQKQILNPPVSPTIQVPSPVSQSISPTPKTVSSISIPPDETAGWKTYINTKCKYSVKFPSNWEKVNDPMIGEEAIYFKPMDVNFFSSDNASVIIEARSSKDSGVNNLQDKIDNYNSFLWKNWTNKKIEEISFENTNAMKATGDSYGIPNIKILILANDCYYEINGVGDYIKIFNQILSTFKFISAN